MDLSLKLQHSFCPKTSWTDSSTPRYLQRSGNRKWNYMRFELVSSDQRWRNKSKPIPVLEKRTFLSALLGLHWWEEEL